MRSITKNVRGKWVNIHQVGPFEVCVKIEGQQPVNIQIHRPSTIFLLIEFAMQSESNQLELPLGV